MKDRTADTIAELLSEMQALEKLKVNIIDTWENLPSELREKKIHESAIALQLHNFYTECEKMFELIADDLNGGVPQSRDWHKRLLHSMTLEIPGVRPAVISIESELLLKEYLAFRHIVRNIYAFEIDSERLAILMNRFEKTFDSFKKDLFDFIELLRSV